MHEGELTASTVQQFVASTNMFVGRPNLSFVRICIKADERFAVDVLKSQKMSLRRRTTCHLKNIFQTYKAWSGVTEDTSTGSPMEFRPRDYSAEEEAHTLPRSPADHHPLSTPSLHNQVQNPFSRFKSKFLLTLLYLNFMIIYVLWMQSNLLL